jgi:hypothetical protein
MMRARVLALTLIAALAACQPGKTVNDPDLQVDPQDATARVFEGVIVALRPHTNTILIDTNELPPNHVLCKYDATTKIFLDGKPATLVVIRQYMPVKARGRVQRDYFQLEIAKFSSQLPANVRPAPSSQPAR